MNKFRIPIVKSRVDINDVFIDNGYIRKPFEDVFKNYDKAIDFLKNNNVKASFHNVFIKDNHIALFSNWEGNEYNQMVKNPHYIEAYDITQIQIYL